MHKSKFHGLITSSYLDAASHLSHPHKRGTRRIMVYVEGYEDIPFWREIFSDFESESLEFEINVPSRNDMAKGKRVLLSMAPGAGKNLILCMDSDFDYIFQGQTPQSREVLENKYIIHTFAYSIENLLCYAPSLKKIAVRASKNDNNILDIERFVKNYSSIIYPLFLWYAYSALLYKKNIFVLSDFRNAIRLNYIDTSNEGYKTLDWLKRSVKRRLASLETKNEGIIDDVKQFGKSLNSLGISRENCYLYINGHALMDNIAVILNNIVDRLRDEKLSQIKKSTLTGIALSGEMSNYKNSLIKVIDLLKNNTGYKESALYLQIVSKIKEITFF